MIKISLTTGLNNYPGAIVTKNKKQQLPLERLLKNSQLRLSIHSVPVRALLPWQKTDISVELRSPGEAGIYESKWRMSTANGLFFGDTIWVIITVEPAGTLALTQQMDKFSTTDNEGASRGGNGTSGVDRSAASLAQNPFALRQKPNEDQTMQ